MPLRAGSHPSFNGQLVVLEDDLRLLPEVHFVQATIDFGHANGGESDSVTITVPATWVTSNSKIVCSPAAVMTADHDPLDVVIEAITVYPTNLVPGVGFDIVAFAPNDSWGRYLINAMG